MNLYLNEYQSALLRSFWTLEVDRGLIKLHYKWHKGKYNYDEADISPDLICKKHRIIIGLNDFKNK